MESGQVCRVESIICTFLQIQSDDYLLYNLLLTLRWKRSSENKKCFIIVSYISVLLYILQVFQTSETSLAAHSCGREV